MTQDKTYHGVREEPLKQPWGEGEPLPSKKKWKIFQGECPRWFLKNKQNLNRQNSVLYYAMLSHSVVSSSSWLHGVYPTRLLCPWDFPGKNTGVGFHFLLPWIFLTGELNWGLLHCRWILYQLSYQGSPNCVSEGIFPQSTSICWVCVCVCFFFPRQSLHPRNTVGKILKKDFFLGLYFWFFVLFLIGG